MRTRSIRRRWSSTTRGSGGEGRSKGGDAACPRVATPRAPPTVFITSGDATCDACHEDLGRHAWITLGGDRRAFCLACADLDHLEFLPAGDAALTRRARAHSTLSAVVLKWSRARKRYERQGLIVEAAALERAETECLSDADARARRREREAERRASSTASTSKLRRPRARAVPRHPARTRTRDRRARLPQVQRPRRALRRGEGARRRGRDLAVAAHVRHRETDYDRLLASGLERHEARDRVAPRVREVLLHWQSG
jgi:hypothetical protein